MAPSLAGSAVWYAQRGHLVFPLRPDSKTPATRHGHKDASMNPDTIRAWWTQWPAANIGLVCGHLFDVIDFDTTEGLCESGATLEDDRPIPGPVGYARTPNGLHLYIRPTGDKRAIGFLPGIDYLGTGGYVIAPPSIVNGARYEWITPLTLD